MATLVFAKWGCGNTWVAVTDRVRELLKSGTSALVNPSDLRAKQTDPPIDPTPGCDKELQLFFSDVVPIVLKKDSALSAEIVDEASQSPDGPYLISTDGAIIPLTEESPRLWHFLWIKTNAAILREALDEIERLDACHRRHVPTASVDRIWALESQRLDRYHQMRTDLCTEVERYLSVLEIPTLRDYTRAWRWNRPLPDKSQLITELQKIEHRANFEYVATLEGGKKTPPPLKAIVKMPRSHTKTALKFCSIISGGAVILAKICDYWHYWWMKAFGYVFIVACGYLLHSLLCERIQWNQRKAAIAASVAVLLAVSILFLTDNDMLARALHH